MTHTRARIAPLFQGAIAINAPRTARFEAPRHYALSGTPGLLQVVYRDPAFEALIGAGTDERGNLRQPTIETDVPRTKVFLSPLDSDKDDRDIMEACGYQTVRRAGADLLLLRHFHAALLSVQVRPIKPMRVIGYTENKVTREAPRPVSVLCASWMGRDIQHPDRGDKEGEYREQKYVAVGFELCALDPDAPSVWYKGDEIVSLK